MKNLFLLLAMLVFTCPTFAQTRNFKLVKAPSENPANEKRKAVVIGISEYGEGRSLDNALNDANDMAEVFTQLGFEVTLLTNNDYRGLETNLTDWYKTIEKNDMAVFYFAGYGVEADGENYLIPIDAELNSEADVKHKTLKINLVLDNMNEKGVDFKLIILEACLDNPITKNISRSSSEKGLAQMKAPKGMLIAFAAEPGSTSHDAETYNLRNGVFTHFLKKELLTEGATIDNILNRVTGQVAKLTNDKQLPYKTGILTSEFCFIPNNENPLENPAPPPTNFTTEIIRQADIHYNNKSYSDAVQLYRQAAEQGNAYAQTKLGHCFRNGYGVEKDDNQAFIWYTKAAEQNYADAQNRLGDCYYYGYGVSEDDKKAVEWYRKAAAKDYASAQYNLGFCYRNGFGVTKDDKQGVEWYTKAAKQGNTSAQRRLADCYYYGYGVTKDYNQALDWYRKVAEKGNAYAQYKIGYCYRWGNGVTKDDSLAVLWYTKAAEQGYVKAQYNLGVSYSRGSGVAIDYNKAEQWYRKAADQGDISGQFGLGWCYQYGYGVEKDDEKAVEWYTKAAEQGQKDAQNNLGNHYSAGKGVKKDDKQAVYWYKKSAEQGNIDAQRNLGARYRSGTGVTRNIDQAVYWLKKAVDGGNQSAKDDLEKMGISYP